MLTLVTGKEYHKYGLDAISHVRRLRFPRIQNICSTHAQIGLWPTPRGGFTIADADAIKVRLWWLLEPNCD
jgi:hypothetical protein